MHTYTTKNSRQNDCDFRRLPAFKLTHANHIKTTQYLIRAKHFQGLEKLKKINT